MEQISFIDFPKPQPQRSAVECLPIEPDDVGMLCDQLEEILSFDGQPKDGLAYLEKQGYRLINYPEADQLDYITSSLSHGKNEYPFLVWKKGEPLILHVKLGEEVMVLIRNNWKTFNQTWGDLARLEGVEFQSVGEMYFTVSELLMRGKYMPAIYRDRSDSDVIHAEGISLDDIINVTMHTVCYGDRIFIESLAMQVKEQIPQWMFDPKSSEWRKHSGPH